MYLFLVKMEKLNVDEFRPKQQWALFEQLRKGTYSLSLYGPGTLERETGLFIILLLFFKMRERATLI